MATYAAISAVGRAILGLLEQSCSVSEFEGTRFQLYKPGDLRAPMEDGVSLFLYRVAASQERRNLPAEVNERRRLVRRVPVDLHFLLTLQARSAEKQLRLLAWCMRTLEDMPTLSASFLNHYGSPDHPAFSPGETATVVFDPLSSQDMLYVSERGKPNIQVSVAYVAQLGAMELPAVGAANPPVQMREYAPAA